MSTTVDKAKYPRLHAYIESLPKGLDSYPTYVQKASIARQFIEWMPTKFIPNDLPSTLDELVKSPPPVSSWVSEARATGLMLAVSDVRYSDEASLLDDCLRFNRSLLSSSLYKILMFVATPALVLRGSHSRWGTFHRGIKMEANVQAHAAEITLRFPPHLISQGYARAYSTAFRAALEVAGAKRVDFDMQSWTPEKTSYAGTWR